MNITISSQKNTLKIQSLKNHLWIADQCIEAKSFLARLKGLLGTKSLVAGQGLLLRPCNDIHMWFMSIPIDVVFITQAETSSEGRRDQKIFRVTSIRENLRPWRLFPVRDQKAHETIELPVGTIQRCQIMPGDDLCIS